MLAPTHIAFGLFFALLLSAIAGYQFKINLAVYLFCILGSIFPDIDHPASLIGRIFWFISKPLDKKFGHRTITHSLLGWFIVGLIFAPLIIWNKQYYLFFMLAYFSHLVIDMANIRGVLFFWPNRRPHVWGSIYTRIKAGDSKELSLFFLFLLLGFLTLPISRYGIKNSLGYLVGDHRSAVSVMLRSDKKVYLDFEAIDSRTRRSQAGKGIILSRVGDKYFIIGWGGKVYTISDYGEVDLLSSRERIDYTDQPDVREVKKLQGSSWGQLLKQLPDNFYYQGRIIHPKSLLLVEDLEDNYRIKQSNNVLQLNFVSKTELKNLEWEAADNGAAQTLQTDVQKYKLGMQQLLVDLQQGDGLTPLGRQKLGIDYTRDPRYKKLQSQYTQALALLQTNLNKTNTWKANLILVPAD